MSQEILSKVEKAHLRKKFPSSRLATRSTCIPESWKAKKNVSKFSPVSSLPEAGSGTREMFTVRRIVQGEGVERKFPLHSPRIAKVEVKRSGVVRRAKLYYLRDRIGKATRLKERRTDTRKS